MEWRDQQDIVEEDQEPDYEEGNEHNQLSNSMTEAKLKEYKDFSRCGFDLAKYKAAQEDVQIMSIDVTYSNKPAEDSQGRKVMRPVIKIYAVNKDGNSLLVHVKDFIPYFYVPFPRGLVNTHENLQLFREALNKLFRDIEQSRHKKEYFQKNIATEEAVLSLQAVKRVNIRGYVPKENEQNYLYLKINTCSPNVVAPLRNIFERQNRIRGILLPTQTFESNIPYALRFMVDKGLTGMGWFRIKGNQYKLRQNLKQSTCQIELECSESAIEQLKCQGDWAMIAPLRVLSFDIECATQHGFPSAQKDPIIQIACVCKTLAGPVTDQYRVVLVLNGCSSISGAEIKQTNDEGQLLVYFQQLMLSYDPDFIIGYNIINFDLPYILDRAAKLKLKNYGHFGRSHTISRIKKGRLQSKIMGNRQIKDINIEGRIQLDLLIHMHRQHKLSSYSLNNVSYHFLRDQKEDVHHTEVYKLFMKDRDARKRLAIYCLKDADLPLKLMEKLCCLYNYAEMARVTGVTVNFLLNRGQQIKVVSQLLRKARQKNFILPTNKATKGSEGIGFEGAYVLDPMVGFYKQPIATLDFASLYPSIMMAHNLCYTTLVNANQLEELGLTDKDVRKTPEGYYFIKNRDKREGLLPQILQQLISARKKAKQELAKATDQMMKNVLEGRQLALKISANSVYGFTGATVGQLPCLEISASVTAYGREMIDQTRNKVKQIFPGSEVIYGDTDSVMVRFKLEQSQGKQINYQIEESMEFGRKAAQLISKQFISPIKLQFQKVYCPFLLMAKKRYVGVYYSSRSDKPDKIDKKGFESVRRDNCYLIREMLQNILDLLLCQNDVEGIATYVKKMVADLVQNKIDISKLVITKAISKNTEDDEDEQKGKASGKSGKNTYKVKQAHVQLAHKMQKRDENRTMSIGDRISYVMIAGQKGSKNYENAEDPIKVLNQDIPIDYDYYIQKQLRPPLERLLNKTNIIPNLDALFFGDHTKNRYMPKVNKNNFLGKFVTVYSTCINCPTKSTQPLCDRCKNKSLQILVAKQLQMQAMKAEYRDLWTECQKCQGSETMQILCENNDCPIYYRRIKIKNDIQGRKKHVSKLSTLCYEQIECPQF